MKPVKQLYEEAVHEYCRRFCNHMWEDDTVYDPYFWVGGDIGGIIKISDLFLDFETIRIAVDNHIDWDTFIEWYDYHIEGGKIKLTAYAEGLRDKQND